MDSKIIHDHYQNFKRYGLHKAQLIIADIPYNIGEDAYGSNPSWYVNGDNSNGESDKAGSNFFRADENFNPAEFMHFCSSMMKKEPKDAGQAPCMVLFCGFEQQMYLIELAKKYGINNYINLVFRKNYSAQVLKANMRVVGNAEYGLILYRDKLPKFNNSGKMVYNVMDWKRDTNSPKIHPTQKPIDLLTRLIEIFTDKEDIVIDPVSGSGATIVAAIRKERKGFGFEIDKKFHMKSSDWVKSELDIKKHGYPKAEMEESNKSLFNVSG